MLYHAPSIHINTKTTFFWDVMLCSLVDNTNVPQEPAASIFSAEE
jgi:hypothetical protein